MKILVTGGAGFIGQRLIALLEKEGHGIKVLDLKAPQPIDLLDVPATNAACEGCDVIYHLAAEHRDDVFPRSRYYDVNVQGTKNLLAAAAAHNITRVIFTSSVAVYGLNAGTSDEDSVPHPFNDYGQSKLEAEAVLKDWVAADAARSLTIVRPVVVFGENNRGNVYTLINQISSGKFLMIGNGRNKKSMAYVGNVADFLVYCLPGNYGTRIYNYADKPDLSVSDLATIVYRKLGRAKPAFALPYGLGLAAGYVFDGAARLTGKRFPISAVRVQKFCAETTCAADRARQTGFTPRYTLEEGIERMIDHDFAASIVQKAA